MDRAVSGHASIREDSDDLRQKALRYLGIFYRRRLAIAAVATTVLLLGMARTLMMTPLYTATVRLQIDREAVKVVEGGNIAPAETAVSDFLRTQYELLQSRSIAARVVATLKLAESPDFQKRMGYSIGSTFKRIFEASPAAKAEERAALETAATVVVMDNIGVRPVPGSRLVDVSYTDPVPARAQRIANAYAEAFIASAVDKRFEANSFAKTFLDDQLKQLKLRLEDSERELLEFAADAEIIETSDKASIAETNLARGIMALGGLTSERIKAEQLWQQVEKSDAISNPQVLTNGVIDGLRVRRNSLVAEYQEKLETFKPSYPSMVQIEYKIREIDRQLSSEVRTIRASLKAGYEAAASQEQEMRKHVDELKGEVLKLQERMIKYNILKREVDTNRGLYNGLLQRFKEVDVASGATANNIFVIDRAVLPESPSSPRIARALLLTVMLGLGAGLGTAVLLDRLDDRIQSIEDLEQVAGLPTLGVIPKVDANTRIEISLKDLRSPPAEAYRSLATTLQFSTERGLPKSLAITSAGPSEGKSATALALGRHFAAMGLRVLLVDGDLRNPSLHKKLGRDNDGIGLSNYLTGGCTPPEALQSTEVPNLAFMSAGPLPPNAADLLAGTRIHSLVSVGTQVFDLILIDSPPVLGLADAPLLSSAVEATIFVAAAGQSRSGLIRGGLKRLQLARAPIIGTVLTKFDARSAGYAYGYDYAYDYGYGTAIADQTPRSRRSELGLPSAGSAT